MGTERLASGPFPAASGLCPPIVKGGTPLPLPAAQALIMRPPARFVTQRCRDSCGAEVNSLNTNSLRISRSKAMQNSSVTRSRGEGGSASTSERRQNSHATTRCTVAGPQAEMPTGDVGRGAAVWDTGSDLTSLSKKKKRSKDNDVSKTKLLRACALKRTGKVARECPFGNLYETQQSVLTAHRPG